MEPRIRLHDAVRVWLMQRAGALTLSERHRRLLAAYETPVTLWEDLPTTAISTPTPQT